MLRLLIVQLILFSLPFAAYAGYLYLTRSGAAGNPENWSGVTGKLVIGGLALAVLGLLGLTIFDGARPGSVYVPAHVQDGKITPGRFE